MAHPATSHVKKQVEKGIPRPKIAELLQIPRGYRLRPGTTLEKPEFILVNESLEGPIKPSEVQLNKDYTRDEIIVLIGGAYREFTDLVKELDESKIASVKMAQEIGEARKTVMEMHKAATGLKEPDRGYVLDAERGRNIRNQALNVLTTIAYGSHNAGDIREMARKFLNHVNEKHALLVNEKPTTDANATEVQGPAAPAESSDDNGATGN